MQGTEYGRELIGGVDDSLLLLAGMGLIMT